LYIILSTVLYNLKKFTLSRFTDKDKDKPWIKDIDLKQKDKK